MSKNMKIISRLNVLLLIPGMLSVSSIAYAESGEWRKPLEKELETDSKWRLEDKNRYLVQSADFDGDGKKDIASLLVNTKLGKMGLFVEFGKVPEKKEKLDELPVKNLEWLGIGLVTEGKIETACGKGYFECAKGEPKIFEVELPVINYFKDEGANQFFYFDKKNDKFKKIQISD